MARNKRTVRTFSKEDTAYLHATKGWKKGESGSCRSIVAVRVEGKETHFKREEKPHKKFFR